MFTTISYWVEVLRSMDALVTLPFCVGGVVLMAAGWRMWKVSTVLTFALIGAIIGIYFGDDSHEQLKYALLGAVLLGISSFPPVNFSVSLLGGLIGGGIVYSVLEFFGLYGAALWIASGLATVGLTAMAAVHLRQVIILITAFEGAVLFISGLAVFILQSSEMTAQFHSIALASGIFLPFVLTVPTVVGTMVQMADVRQRESGMAKA